MGRCRLHFEGKQLLFLDWESFYDTKSGYGLKELSITEYIRDSRFKAHGLAYRWGHDERTHWISGDHTISGWVVSVDWSNTVVICHNVKFDGAILAWRYGVQPYAWMDTVGVAKAVLGENVSSYSLKNLAAYLGLQAKGELKWDGVHTLTKEQEAEMAEYCKGDVDICRGIYEKLASQFPSSQLKAMDWTIRAFIEPKLVLNQQVLEEGIKKEKARREETIKASGVPKDVLSSNKQFAELLIERGYEVPTKISGRTGKRIPAFARTDEGLTQLATANPALYAARIASKANLLESRGVSLLAVAKTGSFPFDVGFSGAPQTHRYSGGSGAGGNPQNLTRKSFLREAICAPDGGCLIVGDFAAIELRILAWLAKEPKLISSLRAGVRVYSEFASMLYGRPINKDDNPAEDAFGKEAILGLGYNMGAKKFKDRIKTVLKKEIPQDEAWSIVKLYRETYFNVPKLWDACGGLIPLIASGNISCLYFAPFLKVRKNAIILPSGLPIQYPNLRQVGGEWVYDKYTKKYESEPVKLYGGKVVENICQGLAGDLLKLAIEAAESNGLPCVGSVHDEALGLHTDAKKGMTILKAAMEKSPTWWPDLKLKAEVHSGKNWNQAK